MSLVFTYLILGPFDFVLHFYWTSFTYQYVSPLFLHFGSWSDSSLEHYMTHSSSTRKKVPTTKALAQMKQDLAWKSSSGQKAAPRKCVTSGKESHASVTADQR